MESTRFRKGAKDKCMLLLLFKDKVLILFIIY